MTENIELLPNSYMSMSKNFLLPLTGMTKSHRFPIETFLFWENYTIENYNLTLKMEYNHNYTDFVRYLQKIILPTLFKEGCAIESYDCEGEYIMVLDLSEWAKDVEMFLIGKYSKFSEEAKYRIREHHKYYEGQIPMIPIDIAAILDPNKKQPLLNKLTPLEWVYREYQLPSWDILKKLGEIGSIFNRKKETLEVNTCHNII